MKRTSPNEELYLRSAMKWQKKSKPAETGLGKEIFSYLQQHNKAFEQNAILVDVWKRVVPPSLEPHCRLDKRSGNVLYIQARPGAYIHQVQVLSGELLEALKRAAPRCGICRIKVVPMNDKES